MFNKVEIQPDQVWEMGCEFCPKKDAEIEWLTTKWMEERGTTYVLHAQIAALQARIKELEGAIRRHSSCRRGWFGDDPGQESPERLTEEGGHMRPQGTQSKP